MASNFHENLGGHTEIETATDRSFGITVGVILIIIAVLRLVFADEIGWGTWLLAAIGAVLVAAGLAAPHLLAPLNRLWTKLGLLIFKVVNPIIMGLIFVVTVVPTGLIMRLTGRDPMHRARDAEAASYLTGHAPSATGPEAMRNQF